MSRLPFISFYFEIEKVQLLQNITLNENFTSKPSCMKFSTSFKHPPNTKRAPINTKYLPFLLLGTSLSESKSFFLHLTADEGEKKTLKREQEGREVHLSEPNISPNAKRKRGGQSPRTRRIVKTLFFAEVKSLKSRNRQERH